ncbi:MAG TPA: group 1 truncated hemoglobin [Planctomycetota bacterium]|nr:group 1 truncated hemoglobin [Planctomycetota bacterium]
MYPWPPGWWMRQTIVALALALALVGCGGEQPKEDKPASNGDTKAPPVLVGGKTLCERLGGYDALKAVVKDFVEKYLLADDRIAAYFATADKGHLEQMLSEQLGEAAGCPAVKYTGKDMKAAHKGMGISTADFNALVEDLGKCLDDNKVAPQERDELLSKLAPMKDQIVEHP